MQVSGIILNGNLNTRSTYKLVLNSDEEFHFRLASELLSLEG
ncbi:hypothetical protein LEP1GSC170_0701 [Leptospira interrogans serovar Bataviae str. HAI135]|nr:hypothetical protein LEP1GSC170_0701 [Leptospira interrogans serovar Bataviae str. HAI135]